MQKIEINTTQNVSIEFEAAPLRDRILAFILDVLIMGGSSFLILLLIELVLTDTKYLEFLLVAPIIMFYTLLMETLNHGQSVGKRVLDIKVVKLNGGEPRTSDYILRWAFRIVDIYFSAGAIASIFIGSSNKNQRIGDMAAETTVIKIKPTQILKFSDIIKINSRDTYEPTYPEVKKLSESNMLLIKNIIDRYKTFSNKAHREAVEMMTVKIKEELQIDQGQSTNIEFLQTLIRDYVVLTRS